MATQRQINIIVVHESASPRRGDSAATINDWHIENGWEGIGYHYVIDDNGEVEPGRPEYWVGAHVRGHNTGSLGICLLGQDGDFTGEQMHTLYRLLLELRRRHPTIVDICGHRDLDPKKTCPGFDVRRWAKSMGLLT